MTSNAALQKAKWLLRAEKAGHTGTLDPLASGLLPLCFGEATKFAQRLLDARKGYVATVRFGVVTTTGDAEGEARTTRPVDVTRAPLEAVLARFVGRQSQVPPMHSALKLDGRPLYSYARAGVDVPREPRDIEIHSLALVDFASPDAVIEVACSKGTYVRVLAEDIGEALGCGAHLAALRRTATGGFSLDGAITLEALEAAAEDERVAMLRPAATLLSDLARIDLAGAAAERFRNGQAVPSPGIADGECAVFRDDELLGLAEVRAGVASPRRVVAPQLAGNPVFGL